MFYVVREDTRTLLDILPEYVSDYQRNLDTRSSYASIFRCKVQHVSLIKEKRRANNYKGVF